MLQIVFPVLFPHYVQYFAINFFYIVEVIGILRVLAFVSFCKWPSHSKFVEIFTHTYRIFVA